MQVLCPSLSLYDVVSVALCIAQHLVLVVQMPPEDVAVRVAQALVMLASLWHGRQYCLVAALVVRCASKWKEMEDFLVSLPACSPGPQVNSDKLQVPGSASTWGIKVTPELHASDERFPFDDDLGKRDCVLPSWQQHAAKSCFISYVAAVRQDLLARFHKAFQPQQRQEASDFASRIERTSSARLLTHDERQQVLRKYEFASPIFALVSDLQPPRLTIGATSDCKCLVPWNQRSLWERSCAGQARYELPPRSSLWQSNWAGVSEKHVWTLPRSWEHEVRALCMCANEATFTELCKLLLERFGDCIGIGGQPVHNSHESWNDKSELQEGANGSSVRTDAASASGSARRYEFTCKILDDKVRSQGDDLIEWDSEGDGEGASSPDQSSTDNVEQSLCEGEDCVVEEQGVDENDDQDDNHDDDDSISLDVDPLESGDGCPQTPPRKSSFTEGFACDQSPQKEARPTYAAAGEHQAPWPASDKHAQKRSLEASQQCLDAAAIEPTFDSVAPVSPSSGQQTNVSSWMHQTLLKVNAASQREQLSKHPQLLQYTWSSGWCAMCEEWHDKSEGSFVVRHCCGVVHCGGCYEEHQGKCKDPRLRDEIQATREALFEKHPELRSQEVISGTCAACSDEISAGHQFLFVHFCGLAICGDCYLDHLPYCTGGGTFNEDFVFGDDESSDDHGTPYAPDPRDETL